MSNPAVITLAHVRTNLGDFSVEDNIGESIHLHLGDLRCDITVAELERLSEDMAVALEEFINVEGFTVSGFSKEFLLQLAEIGALSSLNSVEEDTIKISEITIPYRNWMGALKSKSIIYSSVIKALGGNPSENNRRKERNYYNQTSQERVLEILDSIKQNDYPYGGQKIVLLRGSNRIYDGQHRASCLYYLKGDILIPVIRLGFSNKILKDAGPVLFILRKLKSKILGFVKYIYRNRLSFFVVWKRYVNGLDIKRDRHRYKDLK